MLTRLTLRHLPALILALLALASFPSRASELPLDPAVAGRFARLALTCVHQEYPNKIAHVLQSDADALPPRKLTPAFYGCYDWHSAVHGHWLLARLARQFPAAPFAAEARAALGRSLTAENLAAEVAYLEGKGRTSFERPYGLAWLLQLAAELHEWQDPDAQRWSAALAPLERAAAGRISTWLPKLTRPIRVGEHDQTAFAFGLIWDWAASRGDGTMTTLLRERITTYYVGDRLCPLAYEPGGQDFLSPCLAEADLLRRVMAPRDFAAWLTTFLPAIPPNGSAEWLPPAVVTDPTDPKLAHLDGLNLSRAWMLEGIAAGLPTDDLRRPSLLATAAAHRRAGLAAVTGEHYEGGHWLGSFATYLVTGRGLPPLTPCEVPGASEPVLCGSFEVWEDRARAAGRARDILLIDQRGTGGSNPLGCEFGESRELFPPAAVEACARELSARADLHFYTTEHFVDDVEEVRQRLGYGPLNLRGGSYGTRAMMAFAQRHPASTRTIFAIGVDSPLRSNLAERGRWAERSLARLADLCAADSACAALGPRVDVLAAEVLARVGEAPREVTIPDPEQPAERLTVTLDRRGLDGLDASCAERMKAPAFRRKGW